MKKFRNRQNKDRNYIKFIQLTTKKKKIRKTYEREKIIKMLKKPNTIFPNANQKYKNTEIRHSLS